MERLARLTEVILFLDCLAGFLIVQFLFMLFLSQNIPEYSFWLAYSHNLWFPHENVADIYVLSCNYWKIEKGPPDQCIKLPPLPHLLLRLQCVRWTRCCKRRSFHRWKSFLRSPQPSPCGPVVPKFFRGRCCRVLTVQSSLLTRVATRSLQVRSLPLFPVLAVGLVPTPKPPSPSPRFGTSSAMTSPRPAFVTVELEGE